ncbi:MAG: ABC transporter substrate-binding protein, partial [Dehalococcoidia bacterium]
RPQNRFCCERLLGLAPDGSLVPHLATAWEQDPDAKTITFTLREGVKFHVGSDFDAEAVKWNMDKYIAGPNPELNNVTNVEVTGPYEVKLTCAVWDPYLIRSFMSTGAAQIVSMESAIANGDEWCKLNPVGTGPFKWVGYETDVYIEYEAFDDYWQEGLPYLDGVRIEYVPEEAVRLASFLDDDCQIMHELSTFNARNLMDQGYWAGGRVVHMKGVAADMTKPPFDDIRIRQAMAHAFPTAAIVDAVYDGMYRSTNQLSLSGWTAYNYEMEGYPYNINTAKSLLAAAGYSASNPLQATLYYTDGAEEFYTVWADYMAAVNININLEPKGRRDFGPIVENPWTGLVEYQFSYNGFELTYDQSLSMTLCEDMPEYVSVVLPAEYNDLYEAMLLEEDPEAREEMYVQLNTMAIDEYCLVLPMYGFEPLCAMQPYVHDCGWGTIASEFLPEIIWLGE